MVAHLNYSSTVISSHARLLNCCCCTAGSRGVATGVQTASNATDDIRLGTVVLY